MGGYEGGRVGRREGGWEAGRLGGRLGGWEGGRLEGSPQSLREAPGLRSTTHPLQEPGPRLWPGSSGEALGARKPGSGLARSQGSC